MAPPAIGYVLAGVVGFGIALALGLLLLVVVPFVVNRLTRKRYPTVAPGGAVLITGSSTGAVCVCMYL